VTEREARKRYDVARRKNHRGDLARPARGNGASVPKDTAASNGEVDVDARVEKRRRRDAAFERVEGRDDA